MTDLHTHILPGMDDGAPDVETGLRMLRMEREQGVDAVALTPHYYSADESIDAFLRRRRAASEKLEDAIARQPDGETLPRRILGAEVAWAPYMDRWEKLDELCYEGSEYLLLEPPFSVWNDAKLWLTSGGKTSICCLSHSTIYSATFTGASRTEVRSAERYSSG